MSFHFLVLVCIYLLCLCLPFCLCASEQEVSNEKVANDILKDIVEPNNKGWSSGGGNGLLHENPPACLAPINVPYPTSPIDEKIFTGRRHFYYSGGSYYGYGELAKMLLGRNVLNKDELDKMCPGLSIGAPPVLLHGYGVQSALHCNFSQLHKGNCAVTTDPQEYDGKFGVNPYLAYKTLRVHLVETDSKSYAMYYLCMDGTKGDYQLLTTRPYVSPDLTKKFISMKNKLGFYQSQPLFPVCPSPFTNKPYPFPFQNYPASGNPNLGWSQSLPHLPHYNNLNNGWSSQY